MKILKIVFLLILVISLFTNNAKSFDGKDLVLIQGKVTDFETNKPIGVTIIFYSQSGKQIQAKSNSTDGSYQQVLKAGEKYNIVFKDYILMNESPELELSRSGKYDELEKNFRVKKIETGLEICSFNPFRANQSDLIGSSFGCLNELKSFLENNPKVNAIITIHTHDCNPKPYDKKVTYQDSKNKTKTKKVKVSTEEQLQELAENRLNALKNALKSLNIAERKITFEVDTKPASPAEKEVKGKKSSKPKAKTESTTFSGPTVFVKVGKVLNL